MQIMFHISRHRHSADHQHSPHNNDNNATSLEIQRFCLCLANDPTLLAKQRFCLCLADNAHDSRIQRFSPHFLFQSLISFSFCFLHQNFSLFSAPRNSDLKPCISELEALLSGYFETCLGFQMDSNDFVNGYCSSKSLKFIFIQ